MGKVPARYIGHHAVSLNPGMGPYYNPDGTRRTNMLLSTGDAILMEEREVLGQSYLFDPKGQRDPFDLGVGRVVLPEHKDLDAQALAELGYEFHAGRPDMEPLPLLSLPHEQQQGGSHADEGTVSLADLSRETREVGEEVK